MTIETPPPVTLTQTPEVSSSPLAEEASISLFTLLRILLRGWSTILVIVLVCTLAAITVAFLLPLKYTATSTFLPPGSTSAPSASALMGQLSALGGGGLFGGGKSQGDLYIGILKSRMVLRDMVQQFDLKKTYKIKSEAGAEATLAGHSNFEPGLKDPIVTIMVTETKPELARDLANGYLQVLGKATADLAITESSQRRLFYEQRLAKEKNELANAEVALKQSQEKSGLIAPAGQTASEIQTLASLRAQVTARQVQLASLLREETEENPDVVRLRSEINSLEGQFFALQKGHSSSEYGIFSASQVPGLELEYIRRTRDVKYHEALFDIIAKQYEAARLDESRDSPLQVLDRAVTPESKSGPRRNLIIALGFLAGMFCGCAFVLIRAFRTALV